MELFTNYVEWKKEAGDYATQYEKLFSKYGIDPYTMENRVVVVEKKETFEKLGRKCYPAKATKTEYNVLPLGYYLNTITGVLFFHDRVERSYAKYGYIPYSMTCHNPDHTKKIRRTFEYVCLDNLVKSAGYREKAVIDNLDSINYDCEDKNIEFLTAPDADGHRVDYYSTHRNGSKANTEDLKREWRNRGKAWNLTVKSTYLNNAEEGYWQ